TPTTTRIREICATGTQTTTGLAPMPERCLRGLRRTKFCAAAHNISIAAVPSAAAILLRRVGRPQARMTRSARQRSAANRGNGGSWHARIHANIFRKNVRNLKDLNADE